MLAYKNPEFNNELRKMFGKTSPANSVEVTPKIGEDVKFIRSALSIRANNSITYDFIHHQRLKDQLIVDNLRMENAALDLQKEEKERFYIFCVNAFYQLENVLNYYYYKTYPNIVNLVAEIEEKTRAEKPGFNYRRTEKEKDVTDIHIAFKMNAFCNSFFPKDNIKINLTYLRKVRNEGAHRCMAIFDKKDEKDSLYKFFKDNTFNSIRALLIKLVKEVEVCMETNAQVPAPISTPAPAPIPAPVVQTVTVVGTISNLLPGACFISCNGEKMQVPSKFFTKVSHLKVGDAVEVSLSNGKIVEIKAVV